MIGALRQAIKRIIAAPHLPPAVGPYSAGVVAGSFVFVAQGPIAPGSGEIVGSTVAEQAARVLENIELVLREVGAGRKDVVKVTVYLADIDQYTAMNETYRNFFQSNFPSRIVIEAKRLPLGLLVEMEAVALLPAGNESRKGAEGRGVKASARADRSRGSQAVRRRRHDRREKRGLSDEFSLPPPV